MPRLPQVGGDNGNWGIVLNDFLSTELNADGTLKIRTNGTLDAKVDTNDSRLSDPRTPTDGSVTTAKIAAGGIAPSAVTGTALTAANASIVSHGANAAVARPTLSTPVTWVGTSEPANAIDGDVWIDSGV